MPNYRKQYTIQWLKEQAWENYSLERLLAVCRVLEENAEPIALEAIERLLSEFTQENTAKLLGVSKQKLYSIIHRGKLKTVERRGAKKMDETIALERQNRLYKQYKSGKTLQQIGDQEDLTRERVRQIIKPLREKSGLRPYEQPPARKPKE